jgi:hypothetical protein
MCSSSIRHSSVSTTDSSSCGRPNSSAKPFKDALGLLPSNNTHIHSWQANGLATPSKCLSTTPLEGNPSHSGFGFAPVSIQQTRKIKKFFGKRNKMHQRTVDTEQARKLAQRNQKIHQGKYSLNLQGMVSYRRATSDFRRAVGLTAGDSLVHYGTNSLRGFGVTLASQAIRFPLRQLPLLAEKDNLNSSLLMESRWLGHLGLSTLITPGLQSGFKNLSYGDYTIPKHLEEKNGAEEVLANNIRHLLVREVIRKLETQRESNPHAATDPKILECLTELNNLLATLPFQAASRNEKDIELMMYAAEEIAKGAADVTVDLLTGGLTLVNPFVRRLVQQTTALVVYPIGEAISGVLKTAARKGMLSKYALNSGINLNDEKELQEILRSMFIGRQEIILKEVQNIARYEMANKNASIYRNMQRIAAIEEMFSLGLNTPQQFNDFKELTDLDSQMVLKHDQLKLMLLNDLDEYFAAELKQRSKTERNKPTLFHQKNESAANASSMIQEKYEKAKERIMQSSSIEETLALMSEIGLEEITSSYAALKAAKISLGQLLPGSYKTRALASQIKQDQKTLQTKQNVLMSEIQQSKVLGSALKTNPEVEYIRQSYKKDLYAYQTKLLDTHRELKCLEHDYVRLEEAIKGDDQALEKLNQHGLIAKMLTSSRSEVWQSIKTAYKMPNVFLSDLVGSLPIMLAIAPGSAGLIFDTYNGDSTLTHRYGGEIGLGAGVGGGIGIGMFGVNSPPAGRTYLPHGYLSPLKTAQTSSGQNHIAFEKDEEVSIPKNHSFQNPQIEAIAKHLRQKDIHNYAVEDDQGSSNVKVDLTKYLSNIYADKLLKTPYTSTASKILKKSARGVGKVITAPLPGPTALRTMQQIIEVGNSIPHNLKRVFYGLSASKRDLKKDQHVLTNLLSQQTTSASAHHPTRARLGLPRVAYTHQDMENLLRELRAQPEISNQIHIIPHILTVEAQEQKGLVAHLKSPPKRLSYRIDDEKDEKNTSPGAKDERISNELLYQSLEKSLAKSHQKKPTYFWVDMKQGSDKPSRWVAVELVKEDARLSGTQITFKIVDPNRVYANDRHQPYEIKQLKNILKRKLLDFADHVTEGDSQWVNHSKRKAWASLSYEETAPKTIADTLVLHAGPEPSKLVQSLEKAKDPNEIRKALSDFYEAQYVTKTNF